MQDRPPERKQKKRLNTICYEKSCIYVITWYNLNSYKLKNESTEYRFKESNCCWDDWLKYFTNERLSHEITHT